MSPQFELLDVTKSVQNLQARYQIFCSPFYAGSAVGAQAGTGLLHIYLTELHASRNNTPSRVPAASHGLL